jgi:hypothetical protein
MAFVLIRKNDLTVPCFQCDICAGIVPDGSRAILLWEQNLDRVKVVTPKVVCVKCDMRYGRRLGSNQSSFMMLTTAIQCLANGLVTEIP